VGTGFVGLKDGDGVGTLEGLEVGDMVGLAEGTGVVGLAVGKYVGAFTIGTDDGAQELFT
jgi:hypothetical protein